VSDSCAHSVFPLLLPLDGQIIQGTLSS